MAKQRYVIEGEWTGYRSGQRRTVHREVTTDLKLVEWINKTYAIRYTDGTSLCLSAREARPRERVEAINGYTTLIRDCFYANVCSVAELRAKVTA